MHRDYVDVFGSGAVFYSRLHCYRLLALQKCGKGIPDFERLHPEGKLASDGKLKSLSLGRLVLHLLDERNGARGTPQSFKSHGKLLVNLARFQHYPAVSPRQKAKTPKKFHPVNSHPREQGGAITMPPAAGLRVGANPHQQENLRETKLLADAEEDPRQDPHRCKPAPCSCPHRGGSRYSTHQIRQDHRAGGARYCPWPDRQEQGSACQSGSAGAFPRYPGAARLTTGGEWLTVSCHEIYQSMPDRDKC